MNGGPATVPFIRLFSRYLREQGMPVTHQREAVAEVVFGSDEHLSVDEIEQRLRGMFAGAVAGPAKESCVTSPAVIST